MRLLQIRKFIPRWPWWRHLSYLRFRLEAHGRRPTMRETWAFLGWCQEMERWSKRHG